MWKTATAACSNKGAVEKCPGECGKQPLQHVATTEPWRSFQANVLREGTAHKAGGKPDRPCCTNYRPDTIHWVGSTTGQGSRHHRVPIRLT
ncbi:hypothetical protein ACOMHN_031273 [Nucella lapillus]